MAVRTGAAMPLLHLAAGGTGGVSGKPTLIEARLGGIDDDMNLFRKIDGFP